MRVLRIILYNILRLIGEESSGKYSEEYSEEYSEMYFRKEYQLLRHELDSWESGAKKRRYVLLSGIVTGLVTFFLLLDGIRPEYRGTTIGTMVAVTVSVLLGLLAALLLSSSIENHKYRVLTKMMEYDAYYIQDQILNDVFENSIKMSYKYLDQYYLQTREQARKGFFVTVCVSVFGAILIGIGIMMMFLGRIEPSYVTCASGVVIELIAAIFFYMYNKTIVSMSKYHNKLVLSHNISIALKVADTLPEGDKTDSKKTIITELLKDINTYLIKSDSEGKEK